MDGTQRNILRVVVQMTRDAAKTQAAKQALNTWNYGKTTTLKDLEKVGSSLEGVDREMVLGVVERFRKVGGYE